MLRRHLQLFTLTLFAAFALAVSPAGAAVIVVDNFNVNVPATTTAVSDNEGLFSDRTLDPDTTAMNLGTMEVLNGDLIYTNTSGTTGLVGSLLWSGGGSENIVDGTNDRFRIETGSIVGTWDADLFVTDGDGDIFSSSTALAASMAGANYFLLLSSFTDTMTGGGDGFINFLDLTAIELQLTSSSAVGDTVTIQQLSAVPEPGTAAMVMLGLFGLAAASPRKPLAA